MSKKSKLLAKKVRISALKAVSRSNSSHIGSALSMTDILAVLYSDILKYDPKNEKLKDRDYFILSKGHACISLYCVLGHCGFFNIKELESYASNNSKYMAHVSHKVNGVEFSTGSLGHGLSYSVGIALGLKIKNLKNKVFVILGDGEVAEGSNWEAILFAHHHKLKNLNIIVDQNNLQSLTTVNETLKIDPIEKKFESFGLNVFSCDGHCHKSLFEKLNFMMKNKTDYPNVLIAKTIKGKGVDFMENQISWHYKSPNEIELKNSINQLKNA